MKTYFEVEQLGDGSAGIGDKDAPSFRFITKYISHMNHLFTNETFVCLHINIYYICKTNI
jgi:hypothetical protein